MLYTGCNTGATSWSLSSVSSFYVVVSCPIFSHFPCCTCDYGSSATPALASSDRVLYSLITFNLSRGSSLVWCGVTGLHLVAVPMCNLFLYKSTPHRLLRTNFRYWENCCFYYVVMHRVKSFYNSRLIRHHRRRRRPSQYFSSKFDLLLLINK